MTAGIQRHTRQRPCPICGGWQAQRQGKGMRCWGYRLDNGASACCTREEHAGSLQYDPRVQGYLHWLDGPCNCGLTHQASGRRGPHLMVPVSTSRAAEQGLPQDPSSIDRVLERYLGLLKLEAADLEYLRSRDPATRIDEQVGLSAGYRSLPRGKAEVARVVSALIDEFGIEAVLGTPGFSLTKGGRPTTHAAFGRSRGILIPCRDQSGLLIGFQIRLHGDTDLKYMSSKGAKDLFSVAGLPANGARPSLVYIVEGPHKANIVSQVTGACVIGLCGVSLSARATEALRSLRPETVVEMLDGDKMTNRSVAGGRTALQTALGELGVRVQTATWDRQWGKGPDDVLKSGHRPRHRTIAPVPDVTGRRPRPAPALLHHPAVLSLDEAREQLTSRLDAVLTPGGQRAGEMLLVTPPPGVGKTHMVASRLARGWGGSGARYVAGNTKLATETSQAHDLRRAEARNESNCSEYAAVKAATASGFDVNGLLCRRCPDRTRCRTEPGRYLQQFRKGGVLVGTTEMLFSQRFLNGVDLVVTDDADIERALREEWHLDLDSANRLAKRHANSPVGSLLEVVKQSIAEASGLGEYSPLIGPRAWDLLAEVAGGADTLARIVEAIDLTSLDGVDAPDALDVKSIKQSPPPVIRPLVRRLQLGLQAFLRGQEFNSGLCLGRDGLTVMSVRPPVISSETGRAVLDDCAIVCLDATPVADLYRRLAPGSQMSEEYTIAVRWPANVLVTQLADHSFGKSTVLKASGKALLLKSLAQRLPDDGRSGVGVVCHTDLVSAVRAMGLPPELISSYYGLRGQNGLEQVRELHLLGRPQAPTWKIQLLAHALYEGEAPLDTRLHFVAQRYDGYRDDDGQGREIEVLDFIDVRLSRLFRARREQELLQALHRARPLLVGNRSASTRDEVRITIHTAQPIPGVPVHELVYDPETRPSTNEKRSVAARERIFAAADDLSEHGETISIAAVARRAGASRDTVTRWLPLWRPGESEASAYTVTSRLSNGVGRWGESRELTPGRREESREEERPVATGPHAVPLDLANQDEDTSLPDDGRSVRNLTRGPWRDGAPQRTDHPVSIDDPREVDQAS